MTISFTNPKKLPPIFFNRTFDKVRLKNLISWYLVTYGEYQTIYLLEELKVLGFHNATIAGISLSIDDLLIPETKKDLIRKAEFIIQNNKNKYKRGDLTAIEQFQHMIDIWHLTSEDLKTDVVQNFRKNHTLNSVYMMAFSGARGNLSQVRQLVGMRGLMADPQGEIIDLPIKTNFREGLTVTEYIISSYGARKGLVDTALRTADSGYLTRRLVDVAQDIIIREIDCGTNRGILLKNMMDKNKVLISLEQRLLGRVLFETIYSPETANVIAHINQDLDSDTALEIVDAGVKSVIVRSPLACDSSRSVCQFCYGWNLAHGSLVDLGEAIGIIAAQSIGEPGTQLTMRTFHTGGVFTGEVAEQLRAPFDGVLRLPKSVRTRLIRTRHGEEALLVEEGIQLDLYNYQAVRSKLEVKQGSILFLSDNEQFKTNQVIAEMGARGNAITERVTKDLSTEIAGEVYFSDLSAEEKIDRQGNAMFTTAQGGLLWILAGDVYTVPSSSTVVLQEGDFVKKNDVLAITEVHSDYGGVVRLPMESERSMDEMQIGTSSVLLNNATIKPTGPEINSDLPYCLSLNNEDVFLLQCSPGNKLSNSQIIAELMDSTYTTQTGGIIRYSDLTFFESEEVKG